MIYYISLFIIYFVLGLYELDHKVAVKKRNLYTFFLLLPMFILVAFRSENIGNDTLSYLNAYENISGLKTIDNLITFSVVSHMEPGFLFLNFIGGKLNMSYFIFQVTLTSYIYISFYYFIRKYAPNIGLCVCLLMASDMGGTMNVVRMYLALSTLLFAIPFILRRKWIRFYIIVIIASTLHASSLLFAIMYPLCAMKYDRKKTVSLIVGAGVIAFVGAAFFSWFTSEIGMYDNYVTDDRFKNMNMTAVTIDLIIGLLYYFCAYYSGLFRVPQYETNSHRKRKLYISFEYYLHMALLITLCLGVVGLSNNIMGRVTHYFSFVLSFLLGASLYRYRSPLLRFFIYMIFVGYHISWFFAVLILRPEWNQINPYEWGF